MHGSSTSSMHCRFSSQSNIGRIVQGEKYLRENAGRIILEEKYSKKVLLCYLEIN